jgi:ankyrin repeat protein
MMSVMNNASEATRGLGVLIQKHDPILPPLEKLREFLAAGADPNIIIHDCVDEDGGDSFPQIILNSVKSGWYERGCMKDMLAAFELFVSNPMFDTNALHSSRKAVIHIACELDNPDFLRVILRSERVDVNLASPSSIFDGYTALHFACCFGKVQQARLLLEDVRVDVEARESRGRTPLFASIVYNYGSERDNYDIIAMLISRGCDLMATDIFDCSVLHYCKDPSICRLLLDNGADPLHADNNGRTPIEGAHQRKLYGVRDLMVNFANIPRLHRIHQVLRQNDILIDTLRAIYSESHPPLYTSDDKH